MEKASRVLGLYAGGFCFQPFGNLELEARQGRQGEGERERENDRGMVGEWQFRDFIEIFVRILLESLYQDQENELPMTPVQHFINKM